MKDKSISQIFRFIFFSEGLKKIERFKGQFFWKDYPKPDYESVADHSWRLALMLMILSKNIKKLNLEKALKMAIIHDLHEIISGDASPVGKDGTGKDTYAFNEALKKKRFLKESRDAKRLFGKLPKEVGDEMIKLWLEVESETSFEAKLVKALDKLEASFQIFSYRGGNLYKKHLDFIESYGMKGKEIDPSVEGLADLLKKNFRKNFKEFKKKT